MIRAETPHTATRDPAREELANALTHGIGAIGSVAAAAILIVLASLRGDAWQIVGVSVFATSLIALYTVSTVYHAARRPLRNLDPVTLAWRLAGGVAYTAGTPFYHNERLRYAHALWHLFVIAGSVCHAVAVATLL